MTCQLHVYTGTAQRLREALTTFHQTLLQPGAAALLYTPARCLFACMRQDGTLANSAGQAVDTDTVYEARVFHESAELRWLNDPSRLQMHRTAVLAARPYNLGLTEAPIQNRLVGTLPQTYLLWGEGMARSAMLSSGWTRLATGRIGKLDVPLADVAQGSRVVLHAVEYLAEFEDGNVAVVEERLMKLEVNRV